MNANLKVILMLTAISPQLILCHPYLIISVKNLVRDQATNSLKKRLWIIHGCIILAVIIRETTSMPINFIIQIKTLSFSL